MNPYDATKDAFILIYNDENGIPVVRFLYGSEMSRQFSFDEVYRDMTPDEKSRICQQGTSPHILIIYNGNDVRNKSLDFRELTPDIPFAGMTVCKFIQTLLEDKRHVLSYYRLMRKSFGPPEETIN